MGSAEFGRFGSLDEGWDSIEPATTLVPPNGRYLSRLSRVAPFDRLGDAPKLALDFRVGSGAFKGCEVRHFLSFANVARAKGTLALLGLADVRPSELLKLDDFAHLPAVLVTTVRSESRGRIYANVALIEPAPARVKGGDKSPPDPDTQAA
jgi:hypothetical protein